MRYFVGQVSGPPTVFNYTIVPNHLADLLRELRRGR